MVKAIMRQKKAALIHNSAQPCGKFVRFLVALRANRHDLGLYRPGG